MLGNPALSRKSSVGRMSITLQLGKIQRDVLLRWAYLPIDFEQPNNNTVLPIKNSIEIILIPGIREERP